MHCERNTHVVECASAARRFSRAAGWLAIVAACASLGAAGQTSPQLRLFVNETCTPQVVSTFAQRGAEPAIAIYQTGIDSNDDGFFDPAAMVQAVNLYVPINYTGPVSLDWEGRGLQNLVSPPSQQVFNRTVQEYVAAIRYFKMLRPNAQVGFYGFPITPFYESERDYFWSDRASAMRPIFEESDCIFPSIYTFNAVGQPFYNPADDLAYVRASVEIALQFSGGKPVYPYVWPRYHTSNALFGLRLIPANEFKTHVAEAFKASFNGRRAAGIVWWGADRHFLAVSRLNLTPSHPLYQLSMLARAAFAAEWRSGETDDQHFSRIHKDTLRQLSQVVQAVP